MNYDIEKSKVELIIKNKIAKISFYHYKANSLTFSILMNLLKIFKNLLNNNEVEIIILKSYNNKIFSSGINFDELIKRINSLKKLKELFSVFTKVILNMIFSNKIIIGCISGKAVGGGLGLLLSCDYIISTIDISVCLSELSVGLIPVIIEPIITYRIGLNNFIELSLNPTEWKNFEWCKNTGLTMKTFNNLYDMENNTKNFIEKIFKYNIKSIMELKKIFWENINFSKKLMDKKIELIANLALNSYEKGFLNIKKYKYL